MTANDLVFPVLDIYEGSVSTYKSADSLTTTTSVALRAGYFNGLNLIDSHGREYMVTSAKKLHGVGPCWGFNIFLNQRIRIELDIQDMGTTRTADDIRCVVLRDFRNWHGWESRGDFDELKAAVEKASTVAEIIRLVTS